MQILRLTRSIKQYLEEISDPNRYRLDLCPQCQARCPLIAHGFYSRTLVDVALMAGSPYAAMCVVSVSARFLCCPTSPSRICASVFP